MSLTHHTIDPHFLHLRGALHALLDSMAHSVTLIGADGLVWGLNESAQRETKAIFGRAMQIGDSIDDYVVPHSKESFAANCARALQRERVCVERTFADMSGAMRWYEFVYAPIVAGDDAVAGICFTVRNVTDEHRTAEAIKALSEQNRLILEAVSDGVVGVDREGVCTFMNRAATEMLRTTASAEIGRHFHDLHHLADNDEIPLEWETCPICATLGDGQVHREIAARYKCGDDSEVRVDSVSTPMLEQGEIIGATLTLRDVSSQLAAAAALRQSEERFRGIVEQSHDGITLTDQTGAVIVWNSAMTHITGVPAHKAVGRPLWEMQYELSLPADQTTERLAMLRSLIETVLATGASSWANREIAHTIQGVNGQVRYITSTIFTVPAGATFLLAGILHDVTETRRVQQALHKSEQRLNLALEASSDGVFDLDLQGDSHYLSPHFAQILEYDANVQAAHLRQWVELLHPDDVPVSQELLAEYVHGTRSNHEVELQLRTRSGAYRWIRSRGKLARAEDDTASLHLLGTMTDVTESRRVSEALLARNRELTTLFQISEILLTDQPLSTVCAEVLDAILSATGMLAGAIQIGEPVQDDTTGAAVRVRALAERRLPDAPQDATPFDASQLQRIAASGKPQVQTQPGAAFQTVVGVPMHVDERILGVLSLAHTELTPLPEHLLNLLQNMANHVAATIERRRTTEALHERIREMNCLYEVTRLLQSANLDLHVVLQQVTDILPSGLSFPELASAQLALDGVIAESGQGGRAADGGLWLATAPIIVAGTQRGEARFIYPRSAGYHDTTPFLPEEHELLEEIAQRLALFVEHRENQAQLMAERAGLEDRVAERTAQLAEANLELARAARMKDEFLANMSHELRTPLTGILGLSEALQMPASGPLTERQLRSVQLIENSGRHLLELINDILDIAKIEAGKLELQTETVAVESICRSSLQMVREMSVAKGQQILVAVQPPDLMVEADRRRLKQMLVNLLSNAVKFTSENGYLGIDVSASAADQELYFTVWDTGIGIAASDLPQIFQPFVQLDSRLARQYAGTGLGLALVQRMAALHGGSVSVVSTAGEGSRFTITLPWSAHIASQHAPAPAIPGEGAQGAAPPSSGIRLLTRVLQRIEATLLFEPSLVQLADKVTLLQPDLILLEASPLTPGSAEPWRTLHNDPLMRDIPLLVAGLPLHALPANAKNVHPLPQYFTANELTAAIRQASNRSKGLRILVAGQPALRPRILLAEDNEATRLMLREFLESLTYAVVTASDGAAALHLAAAAQPDIVLMDVQMPGMDGLETMRRMRALPVALAGQMPIVAVTALAMSGDAERCFAAGANEYVRKPFKLSEIAEIVERLLGNASGVQGAPNRV